MIFKQFLKKRNNCSFALFLLLFLFISTTVSAQTGAIITGTVKDVSNMPVPGVNVLEKGTKNVVSTDFDGKFTIRVTSKSVLVFSFVGYEPLSKAVGQSKKMDVILTESSSQLDEVKVVSYGYGTIKKANLTGSVASISAKDLDKVAVTNVAEALAGRLAGVSVQSTDGAPGANVVIRVRGGGSVSQDNSPLYVVDGFIVSNLNDIPPGDIASIDVLKDAATTAIYGAQGANGVVVVTTKKPKAGKTTVTYNQYVQLITMPTDRKYSVLSPYEFASMQYETAKMTSTDALSKFEKYFGKFDDLELYKNIRPSDYQDQVLGQTRASFYNNLSINGGTEATKFLFSYSANNDEGLLIGSGQKRNSINFKLSQDISPSLKLDLNTRITDLTVNGAGISGGSQSRVKNFITARPTNGVADEMSIDPNSANTDDDVFQDFLTSLIKPVDLIKQDWRKRLSQSYVLSASLGWKISNNLTAKSLYTYNKIYSENLRFYGPLTNESQLNGNSLPLGVKTNEYDFSYRLTNTLNYAFKNLGKHDLTFLLGHEVKSEQGTNQEVRAEDFRTSITPEELFANMLLGTTIYAETSQNTDINGFSLFGRADYAFDDKYLLTATVRRDVSSKFQGANKIGVFPAVSVGWKISSEPFLKNSNVINELKLRLSYGESGNDRIPANSTSLLYKVGTSNGPGFGNNLLNNYYTPSSSILFNPDLKWETTINRNAGIDFSLFNSVINGSLDVYKNSTRDLLFQAKVSPISGFTSQWANIGNTSNQGIELALNVKLIDIKDFSLTSNFNIGINRAKIDALDGTEDWPQASNWASTDLRENLDYSVRVGQTLGLITGYTNDGFYTVDDFDSYNTITGKYILKAGIPDNSGLLGANLRPGNMKIKDLNGDGIIDKNDTQVIGSALPKATGGFGLTSNFKGFDISAFFNWSYGNDEYNTGKIDYNQLYRNTYGNMLNTMNSADRFTYIDMDGTYTGVAGGVVTDLVQLGQMNAGKTIWSGNMSFGSARAVLTDWAIEDGSFIRLNNLTIGYSLPKKLLNKSLISNLRLYVTGTNLAIWTKYSGYDPDVNTNRSNSSYAALTPGLDYSSYPRNRNYTFGVNVSF